jgi:hypothetical protein|tara:strand:+ start:7153 stop:7434 length:282 start_codon:yes stop_codon:yes gene_type:complete
MLTKTGQPNALNYFGIRELSVAPPHFEYITLKQNYNLEDAIRKWILKNLKSRFFIGKKIDLDKENTITSMVNLGFEDPKELSYFMLACPLLKY